MFKKNFSIFLIVFMLLNSCTSFKEAVAGKKKKTGSEFFVIKKKPLTLPPDFDELPNPEDEDMIEKQEIVEVKKLLNNISKEKKNSSKTSESLEQSILEKINKN